jgi:hypothetical protein
MFLTFSWPALWNKSWRHDYFLSWTWKNIKSLDVFLSWSWYVKNLQNVSWVFLDFRKLDVFLTITFLTSFLTVLFIHDFNLLRVRKVLHERVNLLHFCSSLSFRRGWVSWVDSFRLGGVTSVDSHPKTSIKKFGKNSHKCICDQRLTFFSYYFFSHTWILRFLLHCDS